MKFLSEGIPGISFVVIFITFMAAILARYVFKVAISWSTEVSILGYMYCMFFGTGKAIETDDHVVFSLVYDKMSDKWKMIFKVFYNVLLIVLICIAFRPCVKALTASKMRTGVLKWPYKIVFLPFLWMLVETVCRSAICLVKAVREYRENKGKKEVAAQ